MKVLWFTNIPLPAVTKKTPMGGGWMEGLRQALQIYEPSIELGIASCGISNYDAFISENAKYFNILQPNPKRKIARIWERWKHSTTFNNEIETCLQICESFQPDLIHIHGTENFFGALADKTNVPVISSLQGILHPYKKFHFGEIKCLLFLQPLAISEFIRGYGLIHDYILFSKKVEREKQNIALGKWYIGRTEWDQATLGCLNPAAEYFHCDEILFDPFYGPEWHISSTLDPVIYSTSGKDPRKGILCLLNALAIVRRGRWPTAHLRLAGSIEPGVFSSSIIRDEIRTLHLDGAVEFLGSLTPQEIVQELLQAHIYIMPSHIENSPNSLCEAMLIGTPCIASYVGGVPTLLRDGVDGLLYHDRDPYALAGKISKLLDDTTLAARLGQQARLVAHKRHHPESIARRTKQIYQEVIFRNENLF